MMVIARLTFGLILTLYLVFLASISISAEIQLSTEEREWLSDNPEIRLTLPDDQPPFAFWSSEGKIEGVLPDILDHLSEIIGHTILFKRSASILTHKQHNQKDIYGAAALMKVPTNEAQYLLTEPYFQTPFYIYTKSENVENYTKTSDLSGKKIVIADGHRAMRNWAEKIPNVKILEADSPASQMIQVVTGRADALLGYSTYPYLISKNFINDLQIAFVAKSPVDICIGINPKHPTLRDILNKALGQIDHKFIDSVVEKWNSKKKAEETSTNELTEEEQAWLKEHKVIRLGVNPGFVPYEFLDEEGKYAGVYSDIVSLFEKRLNISFELVQGLTWQEVLENLKKKEIDMTIGLTSNPDREKYLLFTQPHLELPYMIIARDDFRHVDSLEELSDSRIAAVEGYNVTKWLKKNYPYLEIVEYPSVKEMLLGVSKGDAETLVMSVAVVQYAAHQLGIDNLKVMSPTAYSAQASSGIRNDWPILQRIIQKQFNKLTPTERSLMLDKWINFRVERYVDWQQVIIWIGSIATLAIVLISYFVFTNQKLKHEISERKRIELRLQKSQKKYKTLFNNSNDGLLLHDLDGGIIEANPKTLEMFDYTLPEIKLLNINNLGATEITNIFKPVFDKLVKEGSARYEMDLIRKDRRQFHSEVSSGVLVLDHEKVVLSIVRDISKQRDLIESQKQAIHDLSEAEKTVSYQKTVLDSISKFQSLFIKGEDDQHVFDEMLFEILRLTHSQYGFIDVVQYDNEGNPFLQSLAISNIAWDDETRKFFDNMTQCGLQFGDFNTLFGPAVKNGEIVISNHRQDDPLRKGTPKGHPAIDTFLAIPLCQDGKVIGVIAMANRTEGYTETLVKNLDAIWSSCAQLLNAHQIENGRVKAEKQLKEYADTQTTLIREINHRVKNNLALIIGLINSEIDSIDASESEPKDLMQRMLLKIEGLDTAHRMLSANHWRSIPVSDLCKGILQSIEATLYKNDWAFEISSSEINVSSSQAHYLAIIINELATNSIKHSEVKNDCLKLFFATKTQEDFHVLEFKDNGRGFPPIVLQEGVNSKSHGLGLIKGIVEHSLRGKLSLDNDNGAVTKIILKMTSKTEI